MHTWRTCSSRSSKVSVDDPSGGGSWCFCRGSRSAPELCMLQRDWPCDLCDLPSSRSRLPSRNVAGLLACLSVDELCL